MKRRQAFVRLGDGENFNLRTAVGMLELVASFWPCATSNGLERKFHRIDDHMLDEFALPSVRTMHKPVSGLDDRRITELHPRSVLEHQGGTPRFAVGAGRQIERAAARGGVIVNEQLPPVAERHRVDA